MREAEGEWRIIWQATGREADVRADLVVALLEGSNIPVVRLPASTAPVLFDGWGGPMLPVRVLVPPDRVAEAQELLAEADFIFVPEEDTSAAPEKDNAAENE